MSWKKIIVCSFSRKSSFKLRVSLNTIYFRKRNSRKQSAKFEGIVFAKDREHAKMLVQQLFSGYPVEIESISVVGNDDKTIEEIYRERPELKGIMPENGYIYNELSHKHRIGNYFGR